MLLDLPGGGPVVRAVGVDAGLEPDPGVADLRVGEGAGDLVHHGLGADERHLVLGDAGGDGVADGLAAQVADPGAVLDDLDFLGGLDHALAHRRLGHVHQGGHEAKAAWILFRLSSGSESSSTPSRRTLMPRVRRISWMAWM